MKEQRVNLRLNERLATDIFLLGIPSGQRSKVIREALALYIGQSVDSHNRLKRVERVEPVFEKPVIEKVETIKVVPSTPEPPASVETQAPQTTKPPVSATPMEPRALEKISSGEALFAEVAARKGRGLVWPD